MKTSRLKRLLILFLVMSVSLFALAACDAGEDGDTDLGDDEGILDEDEGLGEDLDVLGDPDTDFNTYDTNADGFLDRTEFGAFATDAVVDAALFDTYDADVDGLLSQDEFGTMGVSEGLY